MAGLTIKPRVARRLYQALQKEHNETGRVVWRSGSRIALGKNWFFRLHYDVIARKCESDRPEPRFEWIKKLRNVETAREKALDIYPVEGTLTPDSLKKRGYIGKHGLKKNRLIKHQQHDSRRNPLTNADREYSLAQRSGEIRMKRPVVFRNSSLLVMKQFPGIDLFELLYNPSRALAAHEKIKLTRNLLSAYQHQIHDADLVHRDIKPENIMVDIRSDGGIEVNIIDFGLSAEAGTYEYMAGTFGYLSPEVFRGLIKQHVSQDLFSLGCVIAEIWGIERDTITDMDGIYLAQALREEPGDWRAKLHFLHKESIAPTQSARTQIYETLYRMLDPNPKTRMTLNEAEVAFLNIEQVLSSSTDVDLQQAASSAASPRMPNPPSGLRPPSYEKGIRFFCSDRQAKSMEENEPLSSGPPALDAPSPLL